MATTKKKDDDEAMQNDGPAAWFGSSSSDDDDDDEDDDEDDDLYDMFGEDSEEKRVFDKAHHNSGGDTAQMKSKKMPEDWEHGDLTSGCYATTKFQRRLFVCAITMSILQVAFFFYTVFHALD